MIFAVKSAFFALSGDSNEQNLDFDLPHAAESADLVKESGVLIKVFCFKFNNPELRTL